MVEGYVDHYAIYVYHGLPNGGPVRQAEQTYHVHLGGWLFYVSIITLVGDSQSVVVHD